MVGSLRASNKVVWYAESERYEYRTRKVERIAKHRLTCRRVTSQTNPAGPGRHHRFCARRQRPETRARGRSRILV